jgi:hypothetical protein
MKQVKISLIKIKSCNALLRLLLVCICSYLQLFLRYKYLILDTYHLDTQHLHEQGGEDLWLLSKPNGVLKQKCLGNTGQ